MPNIEVHGEISRFPLLFQAKLESTLHASLPKDFVDEIVITSYSDNVKNLKGESQPFIRLVTTFTPKESEEENLKTLKKVLVSFADLEILYLSEFLPKEK
jgi:hypothetical protein